MLPGNYIFNSSLLSVVGIVADQQYIIVQHGAKVDVLFQLQIPAKRDAHRAASAAAKAVAVPKPTRQVALPPPSRAPAHPPSNANSASFKDWTCAYIANRVQNVA